MTDPLVPAADTLLAIAREIEDGADPVAIIESRAGWLVADVQGDAAGARFGAWAASTVIDENLAAPVIPRSLFEYLHGIAGLPAQWPVGNAGLLHVYGYLLSAVRTPFGLKGERWLGGELAQVLGLPADQFTPWSAAESTVLQRIQAAALPLLRNPGDAAGLWFWAEETGPFSPDATDGARARTVVVRNPTTGHAALIYGVGAPVSDGSESVPLVTMFPLAAATTDWVDAFVAEPPRLRFNAVTADLPARSPLHGMRVCVRP